MTDKRDVFICHASEDKPEIVKPLLDSLNNAGISYWYDDAEIIWGDSITEKINEGLKISRYVIVILSENFLARNWTKREFNSAVNIEASSGEVRVLPLIVGTAEVKKHILETYPIINDKKYLLWENNPSAIIDALRKCLLKSKHSKGKKHNQSDKSSSNIRIPKIRKKFTQRDKDLFLRQSLNVIKSYFREALEKLQAQCTEVETDFIEIHQLKFISTIYVNGEVFGKCKIWIRSQFGSDSILYSSGNINIDTDNSFNIMLSVNDDGFKLGFNSSGMWFGGTNLGEGQILTAEKTSENLWVYFTENLNQNR